jgi:hypothetical protein
MRDLILVEAEKLGVEIDLTKFGDTESLSKINPLSLPRLYVGDELVASQNPPRGRRLRRRCRRSKHELSR